MPTHEEKWFLSVLFSKYDGKCTGKFHTDDNTSMDTSFLYRVTGWDPAPGRDDLEADTRHVAMVLRDLGLEKSVISGCDSCGQASEVGRTSTAGRSESSERRGYHVVQVSHDAYKQPVSELSRLFSRCGLSGTRDEKSHDRRPRGTQNVLDAT